MSSLDNTRKRIDLERKALVAEEGLRNGDGNRAQLDAAINAAELYMQALRLADNLDDKERLDTKTKGLIFKAEQIKKLGEDGDRHATPMSRSRVEHPVSSRKLTTRENIILLEGSKLNGTLFKPWTTAPLPSEFELPNDRSLFHDDFEYSLAESQLRHFAGWMRPVEALATIKIEKNGQLLPNEATMEKLGEWDMVQDVAPDCSVIASFCVGTARAEKGHRRIFGSIVHPYDHKDDRPILSPNGRYVMRLYFNGCWRRVDIDDRLPTSKSSRVLHVIDRSHPGLIWPALVEKAYLKVRGGYDFPGSNSGTDLAVITGWIPQQIFLHDEDVEPQSLWNELAPALAAGEIMVTLGTGKLGRREQQQLGLGAEHDYAVLDMKDAGDTREMLIKNPWADGDVWKGATRCRPNPGHENESNNGQVEDGDLKKMKPGTFWMDYNSVFQYFEHMYINWDPGLFGYRENMHFSWTLPEIVPAGNLLIDNPQFLIRADRGGEVWILLNRHFRTGDFSRANHGKNGYISLYLLKKHGERVFSSEGAIIRGPFVDSPNTLLRIQTLPGETHTIVVGSQDLPTGKHNFTISVFASSRVDVKEALQVYQPMAPLLAAWTRSTAGGSSDSSQYLQNPQFSLIVASETRVALVLKCLSDSSIMKPNTDIHVKILVSSSDGKRISKLRQRDMVANSGDYKRASTVIETVLSRGTYTIVCSTFEQNQLAKFSLQLYSTLSPEQIKMNLLPNEDSGRFSIKANLAVFTGMIVKQIAPVNIQRMSRVMFKATQARGQGSSLFKMSLEQGQGPYRRCIASSASDDNEFTPIASGLRIEDLDVSISMASSQVGGLWLVLEKPGQASTESQDINTINVEALSEEKMEIGQWAPLED